MGRMDIFPRILEYDAFLVMTDISGYTRFMRMHTTSLLHAETIISELIEAVLDKADYPLTLGKLEGDGVFFYAKVPKGQESAAAQDISRQIGKMFRAFYAKEQAMLGCRHGCVCPACSQIGELKIKAILHVGEVAQKQIRQFTEIVGSDVQLVHKLLKNSIPTHEYVLMTDSFHKLAGDFAGLPAEHRTERIEDFDQVDVRVYYPSIELTDEDAVTVSGVELAAKLNQHSFGRMFGRIKRGEFRNLADARMNIVWYLIDGISSGINVLRMRFQRQHTPHP